MTTWQDVIFKFTKQIQKASTNKYGYNRYNLILTKDIECIKDRNVLPKKYMHEFVRISTLELIAREIYKKNISGAVAEVGVFQGHFAQFINLFFPDRSLFLFDTFKGFDEKDLICDEYKLNQDFTSTYVQIVLEKMKYKNNCKILPGYFPETTKGIEESFCFVSLDTDLFNPTYAGLNFFYPRLNEGGYIFVHDYNNEPYPGVKKAINRFELNNQIKYIPIPDWGGTLVITK